MVREPAGGAPRDGRAGALPGVYFTAAETTPHPLTGQFPADALLSGMPSSPRPVGISTRRPIDLPDRMRTALTRLRLRIAAPYTHIRRESPAASRLDRS